MRLIPTLKRLALLCGASLALLPLGAVVHAQDATPAPVATPAPEVSPAPTPVGWDAAKQGDENGLTSADFTTKFDKGDDLKPPAVTLPGC